MQIGQMIDQMQQAGGVVAQRFVFLRLEFFRRQHLFHLGCQQRQRGAELVNKVIEKLQLELIQFVDPLRLAPLQVEDSFGPPRHQQFHLLHFQCRLPRQKPFRRERAGQLGHFDGIERFLEHEQLVGLSQPRRQILLGIIRKRRANDDLDGRINLPDAGNGFHTVNARHADVHKGHLIMAIRREGLADFLNAFKTGKSVVEFISGVVRRPGG